MARKILYVGGFKLPDKNAAAQRVINNAKALRSLGHDVVLVGVTDERARDRFDSKGFECAEISYPRNVKDWFKYITSISKLSAIIATEKPDVLILYNYPSAQIYRLVVKYANRIKILADITEWYEPNGFSPSAIIKRVDVWSRMNYLHFKLDGLIVISSFLEKFYSKSPKPVILIPPLIDPSETIWLDGASEKNKERVEFVYSGSPGTGGKDKLDVIISAFNYGRDNSKENCQLNIVGLTEEAFRNDFRVDHLDFTHVVFWGRVSHEKAIEIVKRSHFSVFFRDSTLVNNAGFPTKFVESISVGTPVITNATSDLPMYFNNYPEKLGYLVSDLDNMENVIDCFGKAFDAISNGSYYKMSTFCKESGLFYFNNYVEEFRSIL